MVGMEMYTITTCPVFALFYIYVLLHLVVPLLKAFSNFSLKLPWLSTLQWRACRQLVRPLVYLRVRSLACILTSAIRVPHRRMLGSSTIESAAGGGLEDLPMAGYMYYDNRTTQSGIQAMPIR